jgi:site-specific recombinase XerD
MNRRGEPLTRFGIHTMVKRYVEKILPLFPSLKQKRVSLHTIRHTTATHLLQSGVDINTIRAWLGHVSINTTNIYAEVDLEMKAKALACCEIEDDKPKKRWRDDKDLMNFLDSI